MRSAHERHAYLQELRVCVNARSVWLFRSLIERYSPILGKLSTILQAKSDEQLALLIDDLQKALTGKADNQLATQLCAPWLLSPDRQKS
jgi:hypothetical protein